MTPITLTLPALLGLSTAALAQDSDHDSEPGEPLAIPIGEEPAESHAPAPLPPAERPGPLAIPNGPPGHKQPPMSPQKLQALRDYEAQRLQIRGETEVRTEAVPVFGWGWSWGWRGRYHPHTTVGVAYAPVGTSRGWGIYQGPDRLSTIDALTVAGDSRLAGVEQTISRKRNTARGWYTVAGVGGAAAVSSVFGRAWADTPAEYNTWTTVGVVGGISTVVGLVAGAGPSSDARALQDVPARSMSLSEARAMVDRYNDGLRQRLGLTPAEVWSIENRDDGPPR